MEKTAETSVFSAVIGKIRVQAFSENIIRAEYSENGEFCDKDTFFIPCKKDFTGYTPVIEKSEKETVLIFQSGKVTVDNEARSLKGLKFSIDGKTVYRYKRAETTGELPSASETPEVFAVYDTPRIILPKNGYGISASGKISVKANSQDVYLLICNKNADKLRSLYVSLTGKSELPRIAVFGLWDSRYYKNDDISVRNRINEYKKRNVPLDVFVFDTDWRKSEDGTGYTVDEKLFPDIAKTVDFVHAQGVETVFNDHPKPVDGCRNMFSRKEMKFRENGLKSLLEKGADILWYDRNWTTHLKSPTKAVKEETFGMYAFYEITKNFYREKNSCRRPVIMGNVNNVWHGLYLGKGFFSIKDAASHRFPVQWTGDIGSSGKLLYREITNLTRASENGISYINSDCGGHSGELTDHEYIRWMQFGCFTPVLRPHCSNEVKTSKEPWAHGERAFNVVSEYIKMRYRLLPYTYSGFYKNYKSGRPMFKSLSYLYPKDETAVKITDEYLFGDEILIAPVYSEKTGVIGKENFVGKIKAEYFSNTELIGEPVYTTFYDDLFIYLEHVRPHKKVPATNFSARFTAKLKFDKDIMLSAHSGDGITVIVDGKTVYKDDTVHFVKTADICKLKANKTHDVTVEWFYKDRGDASVALYYTEQSEASDKSRKIYLPEGEWINVFSGEVCRGRQFVIQSYKEKEFPIFVKKGAVIPLAYDAINTKEQTWDKTVFDYYPSAENSYSDFLYEDDGETELYKNGEYCITGYNTAFDGKICKYSFTIEKREGKFAGKRFFSTRDVALKIHYTDEIKEISEIKLNGESVSFETFVKNGLETPFGTGNSAPEGKCSVVKATLNLNRQNQFEIFVK